MLPVLSFLLPWRATGLLWSITWFTFALFLVIIIGFRFEIGGDWFGYIDNYKSLANSTFYDALVVQSWSGDYGYEALHWISWNYFNGVYFTNLVCAVIYILGLFKLSRRLPFPWLSLVIASSYLTLVVAMGYTRQAAAIGFIMMGIVSLLDKKSKAFFIHILMAALFHKTALFFMPVGFLYSYRLSSIWNLFVFFSISLLSFLVLLGSHIESMLYHYVTNSLFSSAGAQYRIMMNVIPALMFFLYYEKWRFKYGDNRLWIITSLLSIALLLFSFVSSTTADRLSLYFIPTQMIILVRIASLIDNNFNRLIYIVFLLIVYFTVMFVWLFFGIHSEFWLPYQNMLLL